MERKITYPTQLICPECEPALGCDAGPAVLYVHLNNGEVREVPDVTGMEVTGRAIVITRGDKPAVRFERDEVFYACCNEDRPPVLC